jgi:hypothetical protein
MRGQSRENSRETAHLLLTAMVKADMVEPNVSRAAAEFFDIAKQ